MFHVLSSNEVVTGVSCLVNEVVTGVSCLIK